jgi:oligo-1,6-glucosidase
MEKKIEWWKNAIVYQIYPLSFKDSNHDGIGDLNGINSKLDYIKNLGIDVIWLSPVYQSPMDDNGYDISDYKRINPIFGTMEDMENLVSNIHKNGMKIIMDLVVNHTSDEHQWFIEAKKSKDNPYRDYYIWRDQPNQIQSVFSGPAWTYDEATKQYYFHLFSNKQPDLNWHNPKLRLEIYQMINEWLDKGIDGFRLDVIDLIGKDIDSMSLSDGPYLNQYLQEMHDHCFKNRDILTVGEMPGLSIERASEITNQKNPLLSMIFQFSHISLDEIPGQGKWALKKLDLVEFKNVFNKLQQTLFEKGWNSLFLTNHDQPRAVSRFGNLSFRKKSSKMLATVLYGMQGTPYVFQGEEIGMTGVQFELSQYKDIETLNMYRDHLQKGYKHDDIMTSIYAKGRDNSRTPFQWDDTQNAGFSDVQPWIDINPNYKELNAKKDLAEKDSIYNYFKELFTIRKKYRIFDQGTFELIYPSHHELFIYLRKTKNESILVIGSFSENRIEIDLSEYSQYQCLITNETPIDLKQTVIPPYYCAIYYKKEDYHANH